LSAYRLNVLLLAGMLAVCGCAGLWSTHSRQQIANTTLPDRYTLTRGPLVIHSDLSLPEHQDLLTEISVLRADITAQLALPECSEPIHIYLFDNGERFTQYVERNHPEFPHRRAFFIQTATRLSVYAQWGDRVAVDLRHEATHACLHAVLPDIPLWLDEGLAKYYEPRDRHGLNQPLLDWLAPRLERGQWRPDLRRLEAFDPAGNITQADYAESWAWVHFLLEPRAETAALLGGYLADLRRGGAVEPLSSRLDRRIAQPQVALSEHIGSLIAAGGR
jgi:hypothetical protein